MASDTITIDKELFDRLAIAAAELNCSWILAGEQRTDLAELAAKASAIRDAPPQCMTDAEREIWTEAGLFEVQLQAAAQRLREALGNPDIGSLDVVEAVDELIAKHSRHAKSIADMREAQVTIVEHIRTSDCHVMIDAWQSGAGLLYLAVDDRQPRTRGLTREVDPSRCLLGQIAELLWEWRKVNLPATGASE